jgi:hypothetical protein
LAESFRLAEGVSREGNKPSKHLTFDLGGNAYRSIGPVLRRMIGGDGAFVSSLSCDLTSPDAGNSDSGDVCNFVAGTIAVIVTRPRDFYLDFYRVAGKNERNIA